MAQILTRIDDSLHIRLKERAAAEGRSLNDLVIEALERELARGSTGGRDAALARLRHLGKLATPRVPAEPRPATHDEIVEGLRGAADAVLEGLEWSRGPRP